MKNIALAILLIIVCLTFNNVAALHHGKEVAIKLENIDNASRNILIHSIAFQKYNEVQYAMSYGFSVKKMNDTRDALAEAN